MLHNKQRNWSVIDGGSAFEDDITYIHQLMDNGSAPKKSTQECMKVLAAQEINVKKKLFSQCMCSKLENKWDDSWKEHNHLRSRNPKFWTLLKDFFIQPVKNIFQEDLIHAVYNLTKKVNPQPGERSNG